MDMKNRTWAEVNLDNLIHNCSIAIKNEPNKKLLCVVKADAYGHGAVQVATALQTKLDIQNFAVATAEEALQLRRHKIEGEILVLGTPSWSMIEELYQNQIAVTVSSLKVAEIFEQEMKKREGKLKIHMKINTGMNRQGIRPEHALEEILKINELEHLQIQGIYTHLAVADNPEEKQFTLEQYAKIRRDVVDALEEKGIAIPLFHIENSAGILSYPWLEADMVRPGIMLYGSNPCPQIDAGLKSTMSLHTRISNIIKVPKGETVGYGRTWIAKRDSVIAVMNIGYADGLFRSLSGKLQVLVRGRRVNQVGRICMDMSMIDVTEIEDIAIGDKVTIIGKQGEEEITCDEVASLCDTISYEIFCAVDKRIPRVYIENGEEKESISYIQFL